MTDEFKQKLFQDYLDIVSKAPNMSMAGKFDFAVQLWKLSIEYLEEEYCSHGNGD